MKRWGGLGLVGPQGRGEGEVGLAFGPKHRRGFFLNILSFLFLQFLIPKSLHCFEFNQGFKTRYQLQKEFIEPPTLVEVVYNFI
jgi:hypothetical protein